MKAHLLLILATTAVATVCACTKAPQDGEYGPYTVNTITDGVYHIQDCNASNPAGETFDSEGNKTHFNNCSDMYLLVGGRQALLIDLSNKVQWAENPEQSLRDLVYERTAGKPLTITFTHNHGDHTGMLPAFIRESDIQFALPRTDFASLKDNFPEDRSEFISEGHQFDLGGMVVEAVSVPGHTAGSMVYFLKGQNIVFTGDAIGSGHGVWIFDTDSFDNYYFGMPHLAEYIADPANGIDAGALQIYGGHYWQKDWLDLPQGREMGREYVDSMLELVEQIGSGEAASERSDLERSDLDTYFRNGNAIVAWNAGQASAYASRYSQKLVYHGQDLVIRQIDEHTWEGNGHHVSNETIYIIEGEEKTLVLDAGTSIKDYDKILAGITSKPIMLAATHVHGDHTGSAINYFPEIYINAADMVNVPGSMRGYKGEIKYLTDGQIIDLGGRQIEVIFTPGHTPGSTSFFDKEKGYGFSGDSFGSTYLLLGTNFSTLIATTSRIADYMQRNGIRFMYPGHYHGYNLETLQRVQDENKMAWEMLEGKREFDYDENARGNNSTIFDYDVTIAFRYPNAIK